MCGPIRGEWDAGRAADATKMRPRPARTATKGNQPGLIGLSLNGDACGILVFALGACLWLAGNLLFRLRHGAFKSALAEHICLAIASAWRNGLEIGRRPPLR